MNVLDMIRNGVDTLYQTNPNVHVNVSIQKPRRVTLDHLPVVIRGVYPHMFQVEDCSEGYPKQYMHPYSDIVTKEIEILELPEVLLRESSVKQ